jgi:RNA polymerase sigma-70 factor (ECF subfamily)
MEIIEKIMTKQEEFTELYLPLKKNIEKFALALCRGSSQDAKELLAESISSAYQGFDNLKSKEAFLSYLFTIIRRKSKKKRLQPDELNEEIIASNELSPEQLTDLNFIYNALDKLKREDKEIIILFEVNGMNAGEICKIMNLSQSAVKVRLFRARKKIKKILKISDSEGVK